jgi:hypothetical protein
MRRFAGAAIAAVMLLGCAAGGARSRLVQRELNEAARTLPRELAAARREGLPLTPADLRRSPPVPTAQNAAPLYREFVRRWGELATPDRDARDTSLGRVISGKAGEADWRRARETLTEWQPLLTDDGGNPGPAIGGPPDIVIAYP